MTELEHYRPETNRVALTFATVPDAMALSERIAGTEFVPTGLRNRPEAVLAAMLTGAELGLPPMASLSKIHVIEGKPGIAAELMRALVLSAGHEIWLEASSNTSVTLGGKRAGSEHPTRITWTMDDARNAGLERKPPWRNYPRAMLTARATGELCRLIFADVLAGISYTEEELRDGFTLDEDAPVVELADRPDDVEPEKEKPKTRTAPKPKEKKETVPTPTAPAPPLPGEADVPPTPVPVPPTSEVHGHGDTVPGQSGPSYTAAQALAIRANELGIDDATRHLLYLAVTEGRTATGNELEKDEIDAVFEIFAQKEDGAVEISTTGDGRISVALADGSPLFDYETPVEDVVSSFIETGSQTAGEPSEADPTEVTREDENVDSDAGYPPIPAVPGNEASWRAFLAGLTPKGKIADALRAAAALSGDPKAAPTLAKLAENAELSEKVVRYLEGDRS